MRDNELNEFDDNTMVKFESLFTISNLDSSNNNWETDDKKANDFRVEY